MCPATGVADFLNWATTNLAGLAGPAIDLDVGDKTAKRTIALTVIAGRSAFLFDGKFKHGDNFFA